MALPPSDSPGTLQTLRGPLRKRTVSTALHDELPVHELVTSAGGGPIAYRSPTAQQAADAVGQS